MFFYLIKLARDHKCTSLTCLLWNLGVDEVSHQLIARQEAHKRIIWACSWNPFGHEFATGSRDKTVKIWSVDKGSSVKQLMTLPQFTSSVTTLSWFALDHQRNDGFLAVGMESGLIELWSLLVTRTVDGSMTVPGVTAALVRRLDPFMCHVSSVQRLAWRKSEASGDCKSVLLASCGADHCVRIFEVNVA